MPSATSPNGVSANGCRPKNGRGVIDAGQARNAQLSYEVFPAKEPEAQARLLSEMGALKPFGPEYVSVTYGAGGGGPNRDATLGTCLAIRDGLGVDIMAHLSLAGQGRDEVLLAADTFAEAGIEQVIALRGDGYDAKAHSKPDRFTDSVELIDALSKRGWKTIRAAAYPDPHRDSRGGKEDLDFLRAKFDAGACEAITQFFFDAESFLRLRDRLEKHGLGGRLVPGLLAFSNAGKMMGFAEKCGVRIPEAVVRDLSAGEGKEASQSRCVSILEGLLSRLSAEGVSRYHIYTLNKAEPTRSLLELLQMPVDTGA